MAKLKAFEPGDCSTALELVARTRQLLIIEEHGSATDARLARALIRRFDAAGVVGSIDMFSLIQARVLVRRCGGGK